MAPATSSSMMAGPVSDTVGHSDAMGERVTVSPGASKARQVEAKAARQASSEATGTAASPAPEMPARSGPARDRLTDIKGIGPVNERKLNEHGIFHFDQIAAWTAQDIEAAEAYLAFDGRIAREDWIGQARKLAKAAAQAGRPRPREPSDGRQTAARGRGRRDLLRQHPRAERRRRRRQRGRDRRADRRQRRRQVDADDDHLRQPARARRHHHLRRHRHHRRCRRTRSPACASRSRRKAAASSRA